VIETICVVVSKGGRRGRPFRFYLFPAESQQHPDTAIKLSLTAGDRKWRIENRLRGASSWATL
jgi:hypothetical protein